MRRGVVVLSSVLAGIVLVPFGLYAVEVATNADDADVPGSVLLAFGVLVALGLGLVVVLGVWASVLARAGGVPPARDEPDDGGEASATPTG